MKWLVLFILAVIVLSLAEAMYYLARDSGEASKTRVVKALTVRIALSILLFAVVAASAFFGLIEPHSPVR